MSKHASIPSRRMLALSAFLISLVLTVTAAGAAHARETGSQLAIGVTLPPLPPPSNLWPLLVPGSFEAENFNLGGEGVAYHDNVPGNSGNTYRVIEDVDIIASSDAQGGGFVVSNFETGEWLEYTINVSQTAVYRIDIRASNQGFSPAYHVEIDGVDVTGSVAVPDTGSWSVFQDVGKGGITLTQGQHKLRLVMDRQYFNVNWIRLSQEANTPAVVGQWSAPISLPIVAIHMHVLPDGSVLAWGNVDTPTRDGKARERVWDPTLAQPVLQEVPNPFVDVYCSGHSFLADGRLLLAGGHLGDHIGSDITNVFDFRSRTWSAGPRMIAGRWYPTNTTLANGEVSVISGALDHQSRVNSLPEVWTATGVRALTDAQLTLQLYPWMHLAPNGKVFNSGPGQVTRYLDPAGTGGWTQVALTNFGDRQQYEGTSVMYEPGKVMIAGGNSNPPTNSVEIIDLNEAVPQWRQISPMTFPRRYPNATILPDGRVLVIGGTSSGTPIGAVLPAELWDPATGSWSLMAAMSVPRLYHSTAVLLPDGRVLAAGGGGIRNPPGGDTDHYDAEYYSPPYLFKGARPAVSSAPESVGYGQTFTVGTPNAVDIRKVTFVGLSSTTHEFNQNQRYVPLLFARSTDGAGLSVTVPSNPNVAPPGYYMLFIVNSAGVPSIAKMVRVATPAAAP